MKYLAPLVAGTLLIPIPQVGNASLIEILWFAVGLVAFTFSLWSMPSVVTDYVVATHTSDGDAMDKAKVLIARGHVRREIVRHLQSVIIMGIGLYAMVTPNLVTKVSVAGVILTVGLVLLAALVAFQSWLDRVQRIHATEVLRDAE